MKEATEITQMFILSKIKDIKDSDKTLLNNSFWIHFTKSLLLHEADSTALYKQILNSKLSSDIIEKIISIIPSTYSNLVSELAEEYVKSNNSEAISLLLSSKSKSFSKEVDFIQNLKKAIEIIEIKKTIAELPFMLDKLQEEISDEDL